MESVNTEQALRAAFSQEHSQRFLGHGEGTARLYIESFCELITPGADRPTTAPVQQKILTSLLSTPRLDDSDGPDEDDDNSVCLHVVLGESGMGKTTLALALVNELWRSYEDHTLIPVYIDLGSVESSKHVLSTYLKNLGLQESALEHLKRKLVIVLDSYDELTSFAGTSNKVLMQTLAHDLIHTHKAWNIILLSRPEALPTNRHDKNKLWSTFCGPVTNSAREPPAVEFDLSPFTPEQVRRYIGNFFECMDRAAENELSDTPWAEIKQLRLERERDFGADEIYEWITKLPELLRLAGNPYILSLIILCLPRLYLRESTTTDESGEGSTEVSKLICATKVEIFDSFTAEWFKYQAQRLIKTNYVFRDTVGLENLEGYLRTYAQNLAQVFLNANGLLTAGFIRFGNVGFENEFRLAEPPWHNLRLRDLYHNEHRAVFPTEARPLVASGLRQNEPQDWLNLRALRSGCLIHVRGGTTFRFFHRSLVEYFAAREFFDGFASVLDYQIRNEVSDDQRPRPLSFKFKDGIQRELIRDTDVLQQLAERARVDVNFAASLFMAIERSATSLPLATMSSNSITILNLARLSLSGRNFQYVQIPSANLQHSFCGATDFRGADLSNVQFKSSWLVGAQFQGANLTGATFGESLQLFIPTGSVGTDRLVKVFRIEFVHRSNASLHTPCWLVGYIKQPTQPWKFKVGCWTLSPSASMSQMTRHWSHHDDPLHYRNVNLKVILAKRTEAQFQLTRRGGDDGELILITCFRTTIIWSFDTGRQLATIDTTKTGNHFEHIVVDPKLKWVAMSRDRTLELYSLFDARSNRSGRRPRGSDAIRDLVVQEGEKICSWKNTYALPGKFAQDIRRIQYDAQTRFFLLILGSKEMIALRLSRDNLAHKTKLELSECHEFWLDRYAITLTFGHSGHYFVYADFNKLQIYEYTCDGDDEEDVGNEFLHLDTISNAHVNEINILAFSDSCGWLASGGMDTDVCIWKTGTWEFVIKLDGFKTRISSIAFQGCVETSLAIASEDSPIIKLVNLLTFAEFSSEDADQPEALQPTVTHVAPSMTSSQSKYWYLQAVCLSNESHGEGTQLATIVYKSRHSTSHTVQLVCPHTFQNKAPGFALPLRFYSFFALLPDALLLVIAFSRRASPIEQHEPTMEIYNCTAVTNGKPIFRAMIGDIFPSIDTLHGYQFAIKVGRTCAHRQNRDDILAFTSEAGKIEVWVMKLIVSLNAANGSPQPLFSQLGTCSIAVQEGTSICSFTIHESGHYLVAATSGGSVTVWSLKSDVGGPCSEFQTIFYLSGSAESGADEWHMFVRNLQLFHYQTNAADHVGMIGRNLMGDLTTWKDLTKRSGSRDNKVINLGRDVRRGEILRILLHVTTDLSWIVITGEPGLSSRRGRPASLHSANEPWATVGMDSLYIYSAQSLTSAKPVPDLEVPLWFEVRGINILKETDARRGLVKDTGQVVQLILDAPGYDGGAELVCIQITRTHNGSYFWKLLWSLPTETTVLFTFKAQLEHYYGLEDLSAILGPYGCKLPALKAPNTDHYIGKAHLFKPLVATGLSSATATSSDPVVQFHSRTKPKSDLKITDDSWVVSAVGVKKGTLRIPGLQTGHVYLLLEGSIAEKRHIIKAHLTFPGKHVIIKIYPLDVSKLNELSSLGQTSEGQQWALSKEQGHQLLDNILQDKQRFLEYTLLRKNCALWAKQHLSQVNIQLTKKWYDAFVTLPKVGDWAP